MRIRKPSLFFFLAVLPLMCSYAANITVPTMELITRIYPDAGQIKLATRGEFDFQIEGGYKFGGRINLSYEADDLIANIDQSEGSDPASLVFKSANIIVHNLFELPLHVSYFAGIMESFCSGDSFAPYFGTEMISTNFRGFLYFPDSIKYNGIHTIKGTGFKASWEFLPEWLYAALYAYQDGYLGTGYYSADAHTMLNFKNVNIEAFFGATFPYNNYGLYRAGLLFFYRPGDVGEFLAQIGIPHWDPQNDEFNIELFYFLFEPRIKLGIFSIIPTFFWHPSYYLQDETGQTGSMDLNVNFRFGDLNKSPVAGGIETTFAFGTYTADSFQAMISPYISFITSGVQWDIKINAHLFPFVLSDLFEGFIGVTAEF